MRYAILIALALFAVACKKGTTTPVTPNTPSNTNPSNNPNNPNNPNSTVYWSHYLPNWKTDTLTGEIADTNLINQGIWYDTIFTETVNDTSFIIHKGIRYYIWTMSLTGLDTFVNDELVYFNIFINTKPDTAGAIIKGGINVQAYVGSYLDNGKRKDAQQKLFLDVDINRSIFKTRYNGYYNGRLP